MTTPLDTLTDEIDAMCMGLLGETIQYAADGDTDNFADLLAYVDYRDMQGTLDRSDVMRQDIMVTVLKSSVPAKPNDATRARLARRPGRLFKPVNPRSDESGTHWEFEVSSVANA